jgi:hypothetical protein
VHEQRERLIRRMQKDGFAQTVEAVAYTWFNRFAALRYMEIHDYLGHGHRVLSSREGGLPEIIAHASEPGRSSGLPGLNAATRSPKLKLAGNQDGELYRRAAGRPVQRPVECHALPVRAHRRRIRTAATRQPHPHRFTDSFAGG